MWRAVFAFTLVDGVLSLEEQKVLADHTKETPFTQEQLHKLRIDMQVPQNVEQLYEGIRDKNNRQRFCELARTLVWCDGDMERQEKEILKRLSCLNNTEGKEHLSQSATSPWMQEYTDRYENIAFMQAYKSSPLFQAQA